MVPEGADPEAAEPVLCVPGIQAGARVRAVRGKPHLCALLHDLRIQRGKDGIGGGYPPACERHFEHDRLVVLGAAAGKRATFDEAGHRE